MLSKDKFMLFFYSQVIAECKYNQPFISAVLTHVDSANSKSKILKKNSKKQNLNFLRTEN